MCTEEYLNDYLVELAAKYNVYSVDFYTYFPDGALTLRVVSKDRIEQLGSFDVQTLDTMKSLSNSTSYCYDCHHLSKEVIEQCVAETVELNGNF